MRQLLIVLCLAVTLGGAAKPVIIPVRDGEVTEIIITPGNGSLGNRSPEVIPISGYVDTILNMVSLSFSSSCGTVRITFNNLSTSDYYETSVNGTGNVLLPVALSAGSWYVTFSLTNGVMYIGEFTIQ